MGSPLTIIKSEPLAPLTVVKSEPLEESTHGQEGSATHRFFAPAMAVGHQLFKGVDAKNPLSFDSLKSFGGNVVEAVKSVIPAQGREYKATVDSWNNGNHMDAVAHGIAALTPVFGPMAQDAAEKWNNGDHAGALGTFALMGAGELGPAADIAGRGIEAGTRGGVAAVRAAAPELGRAGLKIAGGAAIDALPGHLTHGLGSLSGGFHALPDLIEAAKKGFAAGKDAVKNAPDLTRPESSTGFMEALRDPFGRSAPPPDPVARVAEAFDPNTARIAPPAPGNAVYEHGAVDMPQSQPANMPVRPGAPSGPISNMRLGPRQTLGGEQTPLIPQRAGVQPAEAPPAVDPQTTEQPAAAVSGSAATLPPGDAPQAAETPAKPTWEPPDPRTKFLAEHPDALAAAQAFRSAAEKHELPESVMDPYTNGLQIAAHLNNRAAVVTKLADYFEKGGWSSKDILSRADRPEGDALMWKNAVKISNPSKQKNYTPQPATKEAVLDELTRREAARSAAR